MASSTSSLPLRLPPRPSAAAAPRRVLAPSVDSAFTLSSPSKPPLPFPAPTDKRYRGHHLLKSMSVSLVRTYRRVSGGSYLYDPQTQNPRRALTKPSEGVANDGYDNKEGDLILHVNSVIGREGERYIVLDNLGAGTFGMVFKARPVGSQDLVAIKVVKNKKAYYKQSSAEVATLDLLNNQYDPRGVHHIVRMRSSFMYRNHLCLIFELLSVNIYELIKQNHFRGFSLNLIRLFLRQILDAMAVIKDARIIHCDLKPENLLLTDLNQPKLKVIDFGSACREGHTTYTYIQSRFYRSPEVILRLPYTTAIDCWSLGCVAAEMFLGLPLFPGTCEYDQMRRMVELIGVPPEEMLLRATATKKFFRRTVDSSDNKVFRLKDVVHYELETNKRVKLSKQYFKLSCVNDIARVRLPSKASDAEKHERSCFVHFLSGLLVYDVSKRWTPRQAMRHPFITREPFTGSFEPPPAHVCDAPSLPKMVQRALQRSSSNSRERAASSSGAECPKETSLSSTTATAAAAAAVAAATDAVSAAASSSSTEKEKILTVTAVGVRLTNAPTSKSADATPATTTPKTTATTTTSTNSASALSAAAVIAARATQDTSSTSKRSNSLMQNPYVSPQSARRLPPARHPSAPSDAPSTTSAAATKQAELLAGVPRPAPVHSNRKVESIMEDTTEPVESNSDATMTGDSAANTLLKTTTAEKKPLRRMRSKSTSKSDAPTDAAAALTLNALPSGATLVSERGDEQVSGKKEPALTLGNLRRGDDDVFHEITHV